MKVNSDETFGFNAFLWRPALTCVSIILKWNSHTGVICNLKQIFPTSSSEDFHFVIPKLIQFWLCIFTWKLKLMFVFWLSLSHYAFLHTMQQFFPFLPIISCFGRSSSEFSWFIVASITGLCAKKFTKSAVFSPWASFSYMEKDYFITLGKSVFNLNEARLLNFVKEYLSRTTD